MEKGGCVLSKISEMTREKWIESTFPEWGTWLVEEIENEVVQPGNVAMWWLGCTGIWFKTPGGANLTIDLWCGNGKRTHGNGKMAVGHQMANMCGGRKMQPNLRNVPFVIDPFAFKQVDAVLATHYHQDHMSAEWAAHVLHSNMTTTDDKGNVIPVPFIGPQRSVDLWVKWGVPAERCTVVHPGDVIKIKDVEIVALDSFDRTCIVTTDSTGPDREELTGVCPTDMDEKAVNYLVKTPGGNIYHSGDSHFSIYFAKHGKDHDIDVAFGSFGENPIGMQDKMRRRSACSTTSRSPATSTSSTPSSGRSAANTSIPATRTRCTTTIRAALRTASRPRRTSRSAPVCKGGRTWLKAFFRRSSAAATTSSSTAWTPGRTRCA